MGPRKALALSLGLVALVSVGDALTAAEVGFTLLYLLPISIAVWFRSAVSGIVVAVLCTGSWLGTILSTSSSPVSLGILLWNLVGELGVFLAFVLVLRALRLRIDTEVRERESVVEQLRHADRLNTVGKLASGIAHELGTPLNVVSGRAALIVSQRVVGEDARRSATIIVEQTERMTAIIRHLLDFARRGGTRKAPTDLRAMAREVRTLLEPLAVKGGSTIVLADGPETIAPVNAGEIQQVMTNLVMNAIQSMPHGGRVTLWVGEGVPDEAEGSLLRSKRCAVIRVQDQGLGIPNEALPHIFDPFFTTKDVGSGTGLGLSVTFGIVRDHGGEISVTTEAGQGSLFSVFLPTSSPPRA